MEVVRVIPCLDVKDGRVVKGVSFIDLKDAGDPVELAAAYEEQGADELVFLDISATIEGRTTLYELLRETAAAVFIPLTVGGGITSLSQAAKILHSGADKVSLNSAALLHPSLITEIADRFGSQSVVTAIDAKRVGGTYRVFTHGGTKATEKEVVEWAKEAESRGAGEILLTSMDRDGTKKGFDLDLLRAVTDATNVPVIASGGVGELQHFVDGVVLGHAQGVLAASVFHYGEIRIKDVKDTLFSNGLNVRPVESSSRPSYLEAP